MDSKRRAFAGWLLAIACFASQLAPAGAALPRDETRADPGHRLRFEAGLEELERLGVPGTVIDRFSRVEQSETFSGTFTFSDVAGDLDRDGRRDAFITTIDYEFTIDWGSATSPFPTIEEKADSRVVAVSGATGKVLWRKRWKDFVVPVAARVGKNHKAGAIILSGIMSLIGPFEDRRLLIDGLDGRRGKRLWRNRHQSVEASSSPAWAGHDMPVSISLFDGVKGRSTDLLLGVAEIAYVGVAFTAATQAIVIDGRNGRERRHPTIDAGFNWLPAPMPASDLDGNGLDDYVVALDDSPHLGSGQDLPSLDGVVHARRSTNGEAIWTETGFDLNWLAWTYRLPNVVGSGTRDLALVTLERDDDAEVIGGVYFGRVEWVTYLIDGEGIRRWRRWGGWPHSPGDLDRDGRPNVVTRDFIHNFQKGRVGYKTRAYHATGKTIWKRAIVSRYEKGPCPGGCSGGMGSGAWSAGDIDGDRVKETYIHHEVEQDPGEDPTFSVIVDGRTGTRARSGGEELHAPGISFGGRGADLLEIDVQGSSATLRGREGASFRLLWETEIALNGVRNKRLHVYASGARFDGDRCGDLLLSINVNRDAVTAAVSGGSGEVLWQQASKKDIRLTQPGEPKDLNRAC